MITSTETTSVPVKNTFPFLYFYHYLRKSTVDRIEKENIEVLSPFLFVMIRTNRSVTSTPMVYFFYEVVFVLHNKRSKEIGRFRVSETERLSKKKKSLKSRLSRYSFCRPDHQEFKFTRVLDGSPRNVYV